MAEHRPNPDDAALNIRVRRDQGLGSKPGYFWQGQVVDGGHNPHTQVVVPVARIVPVAVGTAQVLRIVVPRAATLFSIAALRREAGSF